MNIATILIKMVADGCHLQVNGRIKNCSRPISKNILKYGRDGSKVGSNDQADSDSSDQEGDANEDEAETVDATKD